MMRSIQINVYGRMHQRSLRSYNALIIIVIPYLLHRHTTTYITQKSSVFPVLAFLCGKCYMICIVLKSEVFFKYCLINLPFSTFFLGRSNFSF